FYRVDFINRRFIPAGAGNTAAQAALFSNSAGLSPLARGTRHSQIFTLGDLRFIPAGAGNTGSSPTDCGQWS
ncbi:hypothetical protein SEEM8283_02014, partial [Salmonella enterica subsp. enterica serovar Montevideo str. IA_2010008283]